MRLTTKGRFAVTAMIDLSLHQENTGVFISLSSISKRQNISLAYLEQLFNKLRTKGLVISVRGPNGGYRLARESSLINVADIILAVNEQVDATMCGGKGGCEKKFNQENRSNSICMTHKLWETLSNKMLEYLQSVSLYQLVNDERKRISLNFLY